MANTYLTRTNGTPTNNKIGTFSVWCKRSKLGTDQRFLMNFLDGNNYAYLRFDGSADRLEFFSLNGADVLSLRTNRVFRDTSAWYHIVLKIDMTQATASDRIKFYVNGVEETSFSSTDYGVQNEVSSLFIASGTNYHVVGGAENGTVTFDGSMSHVHFIDGTAYDATAFGEYDANGVWKIKTSPSVTYGTNGFFILKNGNSVTDQSGNGNNFTVAGGTLTNTEDSPSNVFCTWNPLEPELSYKGTYSNGNTTVATTVTGGTSLRGSIAIPYTGKWYWENKVVSTSSTIADNSRIGIATGDSVTVGSNVRYMSNGQKTVDASASSYGATYAAGDIIGVAVDSDNNTVEFFKNGASQGSISYTMDSSLTYKPYISENGNSISITFSTNFGNGYFGTTAVSSAGTNASGIGIFEFDCPDGYTALSTKGLNL